MPTYALTKIKFLTNGTIEYYEGASLAFSSASPQVASSSTGANTTIVLGDTTNITYVTNNLTAIEHVGNFTQYYENGVPIPTVAPPAVAIPFDNTNTSYAGETIQEVLEEIESQLGGSPEWSSVLNKPSTFPPATHNHDAAYEAKSANIQNHIASPHANPAATVNSTDAQLRDRSTHTGVQAPSTITQDASNRFATDAEKNTWNGKEAGNANIQAHIASAHAPSNATANDTDANLKNRANHTGSQTKSTISDFAHTHPQSEITSLVTDLAAKAAAVHVHAIADTTGLVTALAAKQDALVSAVNIKTINGQPVIGSGDLVVSGSGAPTFINLASLFSSTSVTRATVTGWSFAVLTGRTYLIKIIAAYQSAALTTGGSMGFVLSGGGVGTIRGFMQADIAQAVAATGLKAPIYAISNSNALAGSFMTSTGVTVINSPHGWSAEVTFTCTTSGTFEVQWATEVAASAAQLNANSSLIYQSLN